MHDIEPLRDVNADKPNGDHGLLGFMRELGYAYVGSFSVALEGAGSLYKTCVARGQKTVSGVEQTLAERRRYTSRRPLPEPKPGKEAPPSPIQRQVQAWLEQEGRITSTDMAQLTEQINALTQQIDALIKEDSPA
jgi:polyhydroxyalkanoate synthesis regulator phasin